MVTENKNIMGIDTDSIKALAELMDETGLTEIEMEEGGRRVRIARGGTVVAHAPAAHHPAAPAPAAAPAALAPATPLHHAGAVNSPMVGTAYLASEPGKPAFVSVGDTVEAGATLLIIEAMKVMNPIKAPKGGRVTQILVGDGQPVEFGEALMIIE
jgi:acetyl-CoA carboxylase biotin carboxyl carrier protein